MLRAAKPQRPPFKSLWSRQLGGMLEFPPAIGERASYIETIDGRVVASSARDGRPLWTRQLAAPLASQARARLRLVVRLVARRLRLCTAPERWQRALAIHRRRPQ